LAEHEELAAILLQTPMLGTVHAMEFFWKGSAKKVAGPEW
jgi:hypothetical protein